MALYLELRVNRRALLARRQFARMRIQTHSVEARAVNDETGRTLDRQAIDRFSDPDSDCFIFILSTRAGGQGINLTAADTVLLPRWLRRPRLSLRPPVQASLRLIGKIPISQLSLTRLSICR